MSHRGQVVPDAIFLLTDGPERGRQRLMHGDVNIPTQYNGSPFQVQM